MKTHPSEQQIIDHIFKLDSERASRRVAAHLAACPACREQAEQLRRKLAALDTLKQDISAPERLIADTLREIRKLRPSPEPAFMPRWAWVLAPAAAAAVVLALLVPMTMRQSEPDLLAMAKDAQRQAAVEVAVESRIAEAEPPPEMELESVREVTFADRRTELALKGEAAPGLAAEPLEADSFEAPAETAVASAPSDIQVALADKEDLAMMLEEPVAAPAPTKPSPPAPGWTEVYALVAHAPARGGEGVGFAAKALRMAAPAPAARASRGLVAGAQWNAYDEAAPVVPPAEQEKLEWNVGPHSSVRIAQEMTGFSEHPGDPVRGKWTWNVVVESASDVPTTVRLTRRFAGEDWTLAASDKDISVSRQTPLQALVTFNLPPYGEKKFTYSVEAPVYVDNPPH